MAGRAWTPICISLRTGSTPIFAAKRPLRTRNNSWRMNHVGIGYDVHQLVTGRKLILGGVELTHTKGLEGHSDADVFMHAICDAVMGAIGEGAVGKFIPYTDPILLGVP